MRQEVIILMADDDADDRFLTQSAFEDNDIANPIHLLKMDRNYLITFTEEGNMRI
ncbi:hypothetical protein ACFFJX_26155 [Pseudarcicella hirudinis]|uniref:hypothetical protein n=1 Tax=Pseudarcicella hirudinis TaxID=1079859 RepID=UPI0035E476F2